MRRRRLACLASILLLALAWLFFTPERGERYQGLTASQWESEIQHWEPWAGGICNKTGRWTFWGRKQPAWAPWLGSIGIKVSEECCDMPLLQGDPAAIPVLSDLLASRYPQARLIAAQGLEKLGEKARPVVPALLRALADEDETVLAQVEQALFHIDREAAERAGLQWTVLGLVRRDH
jgi:hypothetical protein